MFGENVLVRNTVMLDYVDEDIILAYVGIVGFHMILILLSQAIVTLNTGTEFLDWGIPLTFSGYDMHVN